MYLFIFDEQEYLAQTVHFRAIERHANTLTVFLSSHLFVKTERPYLL